MQPTHDALVFIVDDDASVRSGLAWLLRSRGLPSQAFDSAVAFDAMLQSGYQQRQACCLLLDVRMPVMSGLALFERMVEHVRLGENAEDILQTSFEILWTKGRLLCTRFLLYHVQLGWMYLASKSKDIESRRRILEVAHILRGDEVYSHL